MISGDLFTYLFGPAEGEPDMTDEELRAWEARLNGGGRTDARAAHEYDERDREESERQRSEDLRSEGGGM